jgi:hypothetical protein
MWHFQKIIQNYLHPKISLLLCRYFIFSILF